MSIFARIDETHGAGKLLRNVQDGRAGISRSTCFDLFAKLSTSALTAKISKVESQGMVATAKHLALEIPDLTRQMIPSFLGWFAYVDTVKGFKQESPRGSKPTAARPNQVYRLSNQLGDGNRAVLGVHV